MTDGSHVGRPSSWITVGVMIVGFIIGGVGLVIGPSWLLFWVGVAVAAVGGVLALAVGIFTDVVTYTPVDITNGAQPASGASADAANPSADGQAGKTGAAAASVPDESADSARSGAENLPSG